VVTLTLSPQMGVLADRTIILRPDVAGGDVRWDCTGGSLQPRYRPASCRPH
jgi:type IV pilus assembly protein PilA